MTLNKKHHYKLNISHMYYIINIIIITIRVKSNNNYLLELSDHLTISTKIKLNKINIKKYYLISAFLLILSLKADLLTKKVVKVPDRNITCLRLNSLSIN